MLGGNIVSSRFPSRLPSQDSRAAGGFWGDIYGEAQGDPPVLTTYMAKLFPVSLVGLACFPGWCPRRRFLSVSTCEWLGCTGLFDSVLTISTSLIKRSGREGGSVFTKSRGELKMMYLSRWFRNSSQLNGASFRYETRRTLHCVMCGLFEKHQAMSLGVWRSWLQAQIFEGGCYSFKGSLGKETWWTWNGRTNLFICRLKKLKPFSTFKSVLKYHLFPEVFLNSS